MKDRRAPSLAKWPFYLADVILVVVAVWLFNHYPHPLPLWPAVLIVGCVAGAAYLAVLPYKMEYETSVRFAESNDLTSAAAEIAKVETVAEQIRAATGQWQGVQEHSARAVAAAKEITERMAAEAQSFAEFMQKANDGEKATLRLEVDKLRRGEGQWLQLLVHLLDHVFALHQAGVRSGQANLVAQLGQFQEACRDLVRRVGLAPFEGTPDEPFDPSRHQVVEGQPQPAADSRVAQTLAAGYTFQGQLLRRSLVAVQAELVAESELAAAYAPEPAVETETTFASEETEPVAEVSTEAAVEPATVEFVEAELPEDPRMGAATDADAAAAIDEEFRLESESFSSEERRKA